MDSRIIRKDTSISGIIALAILVAGCSGETTGSGNVANLDASRATFFDDFEYTVDKTTGAADPTGVNNPFTREGQWTRVKAINISGSHNGYLYTVDRIPGYDSGIPGYNTAFPGIGSNRVLAIEALPVSLGSQTDFYLQYGEENADTNTVPANVWFQFWIYPNYYDDPNNVNDQLSTYEERFKFIYPCNGPYPCTNSHWLNTLGFTTAEPYWGNNDNRQLFMTTEDTHVTVNAGAYSSSIDYQLAPDYNQFKIGQTNISENIVPNRWTLVKIHYDTSGRSGTFEAWLKPLGGEWVKVAEWIDGRTPNFSWTVNSPGGHRVFRIPTTLDQGDSWIYLDDFTMATSESALPTYPY